MGRYLTVLFLLMWTLLALPVGAQTYTFKSILDSADNLSAVNDVTYTTPTTNDILAWDGSNWVVSQTTVATGSTINTLNDVGDVNASSPGDGQLLSYNTSTSKWVPTNAQSASTFSCPSGFTLIQNQGQTLGCISTDDSSTGTFSTAVTTCHDTHGARLATAAEWYTAAANYTLTGETGAWEWVNDIVPDNASNRVVIGNSSITDISHGIISVSREYRCFIPATGQISMTTIAALSDVSTTGAATNDILAFDGTNWVVSQTTVATGSTINEVNDIGDVTITSANTGDLLSWNGTAWVNQTVTDTVSTTTIESGWPDAIKCYNGSIVRILVGRGLNTAGTLRVYNMPGYDTYYVAFNPSTKAYSSQSNMSSYDCVSSSKSIATLYSEGRAYNFIGNNGASTNLNEIGDVSTTGAATNDILAFDGTNWVVSQTTVATGSTINEVNDIGDVTITSANTGDLLSWNGTAWVNQTVTDTVSTTTMVSGWPDAISCTQSGYVDVLWPMHMPRISNSQYVYRTLANSTSYEIEFDTSGNIVESSGGYTNCTTSDTLAGLYASGQAYNFIGNNGASDDTLDFDDFADSMTLDATTSIATGSYDLNIDSGTLFVDGSADSVGIGTTSPATALDVSGTVGIGATADKLRLYHDGINAAIVNDTDGGMLFYNSDTTGGFYRFHRPSDAASAFDVQLDGDGIFYYNVGIGTTSPNYELDVAGDIAYSGSLVDTSDRRLKEDITPLADGALDTLASLAPVSFTMKSDETGQKELGFIAQDVEGILPELVLTADDASQTKSLNYIGLIAPLVKAVQELKAENDALKARLDALEAQ